MWPNESAAYREHRDRLSTAESQLRAKSEEVAALRRQLPRGGKTGQDYLFAEAQGGAPVRLSELFAPGKDTLFLYSFMFKPGAKQPCPMCTSLLDSLNGAAPHVAQRINLAVVAKASAQELSRYASARGWNNLRLLSSGDTTYNRDYGAEDDKGDQWPMLHVFTRNDGETRHFWASELFGRKDASWQGHPRHADQIWPLWNIFDLTPEGRGDFFPKIAY